MNRTRALLVAFGLLETLAPNRIVQWGERLALENPGAGTLQWWTLPMARLEGIVFCWLAARGRLSPPSPTVRTLGRVLGVIGLPALLAPKTFVTSALEVAYENPADLEVKSWVVPFTRLLGAVYIAVALFAGRADAPTDDT